MITDNDRKIDSLEKCGETDIIIVGAGLSGLSCAQHLMKENVPFVLLEADHRIGGRLKTENVEGFLLNYGFQVLQTAYPEARRLLDYDRLELKPFAPGAMIRIEGRFYRVSDPIRRPGDLWSTLTAPIGSIGDRLRILHLAHHVRRATVSDLFRAPDVPTLDFLRSERFSEKIIQRFFRPFFAGVCLDPDIGASSRVFRYILRVFSQGDVALPSRGMEAIARQLAEGLPEEKIRTGAKVASVSRREVVLKSGERIRGRAVVFATEGPETVRLLNSSEILPSRGEQCLYFSSPKPPIAEPFLILNGSGKGWVNSVTVPSVVAPSYSPDGQELISVVVIGGLSADDASVEQKVRRELTDWFGPEVEDWRHLKTIRISHALPEQPSPMPDPTKPMAGVKHGIYICGEYNSVPGIQWALLSGRQTAERILKDHSFSGPTQ